MSVSFGPFIGYQADGYFDSAPIGLFAGMFIGILAAARSVRKTLKFYGDDELV